MASFVYDAASEAALEALVSRERLQSYLAATGNDLAAALRLYVWNTAVAGALYGPLQAIEIALRNKIHAELTREFGVDWPHEPKFRGINKFFETDVDDAEEHVIKNWVQKSIPDNTPKADFARVHAQFESQARAPGSGVVTVPRIVADLSFGFWVAMFKSNYQYSLFGPVLSKILPPRTTRVAMSGPLNRLKDLRNRIAHHEPIHTLNLKARYDDILTTAGLLAPSLADWIQYHGRCDLLLDHAPGQRQLF